MMLKIHVGSRQSDPDRTVILHPDGEIDYLDQFYQHDVIPAELI